MIVDDILAPFPDDLSPEDAACRAAVILEVAALAASREPRADHDVADELLRRALPHQVRAFGAASAAEQQARLRRILDRRRAGLPDA